jgi:hypothetical protein
MSFLIPYQRTSRPAVAPAVLVLSKRCCLSRIPYLSQVRMDLNEYPSGVRATKPGHLGKDLYSIFENHFPPGVILFK